jgi:hypothetical protein
MGQTFANEVAILKEFYGVAIQETFNNEVLLKKYLEESSKQHDGLRYNFPIHSNRNTAIGARAEGSLLPTAGQQSWASVYVTSAYVYGSINLTGQAMAASKKTSFVEAKAAEMEGVMTDLTFQLGRMSYGDGNGILARVGTSADTSTLYLVNQFNKPGDNGARYLNVGQKITVGHYSAAFGSACDISGVKVDSIALAANSGTTYDTVVVSGTVTTSATCYVFSFMELATTATAPRGIEIKGLRCIVDDTTQTCNYLISAGYFGNASIFNVDRNAVKAWNSIVDQNSGTERILDSYLLQRTMSKIKKASGKDVDIMFGEYDTVDAFWDSVAGDRRFNSKQFDAGVDTLTFNGKTMVKDLLCPYNELFLLHKPAIKWYVMESLGFDTIGGEMKSVSGYDKAEAFVKAYLQIAPGEEAAPNSCGVIRDIKTRL